jgi:hypothetical protein
MRVFSRFALLLALLILASFPAYADHLEANCPLSLVATNPGVTSFALSPTGVFRNGNLVHVLRGQVMTTYNVTDLGDMSIAREDFIGSLGARETNAGTVFSNGNLFISSGAGLEIFDLRNVRAGGNAPILVSRTAGIHGRRLAISGNLLALLYPATDLPCYPDATIDCHNTIELYNVGNLNAPVRVGSITTLNAALFLGWNDIAFNFGLLYAASDTGTFAFNVANPAAASFVNALPFPGRFLDSNGTNVLAIGNDNTIDVVTVNATAGYNHFGRFTTPALTFDRANDIVFHPQVFIDDANARMVTMIDERDPLTLKAARTIAFDVFDFSVTWWEGSDPRVYESVTMLTPDERKTNPVAVGPLVYTVGERSGVQTWGACNQVAGRIEMDGLLSLSCGGAEIHGWVTGTQKIVNVELFLDGNSLGAATLNTGSPRIDISSPTPVSNWRINVNLDTTARGERVIRAVGTDIFGNRRQFASQRIFFPGPGSNCTNRRRVGSR